MSPLTDNTVASKAPKARHYSGSESLDYRVKAAACQKNMGHEYVSMVKAVKSSFFGDLITNLLCFNFSHFLRRVF